MRRYTDLAIADQSTGVELMLRRSDRLTLPGSAQRPDRPPVARLPLPEPAQPPVARTFSGTGVFVSNDGMILTNAHVVPNCTAIRINKVGSASAAARLLATDKTNDLALLKAEALVANTIRPQPFRRGARVGESIFAYGFPLSGILPSSGNFTSGNITANAGPNDDITKLQFSAPIQPGNSGGALFDKFGNIVGVVVATLKVASNTTALPQNVNFAVTSFVAVDFLRTHHVSGVDALANTQNLAPEDVADRAAAVSVHIVCDRG